MKTLLVLLLLTPLPVFAEWYVIVGKISQINVYPTEDSILFRVEDNLGVEVDDCSNNTNFAIDGRISESRRGIMFATLLAAHAAGRNVSVAYEKQGGCVPWGNSESVYRSAKRIVSLP